MDSPPHHPPPPHALAGAQATLEHWGSGSGKPLGFFIPYRYAADITPDIPLWLTAQFAKAIPVMDSYLERLEALAPRLRNFATKEVSGPHGPRFDQDWFSGLDAALAYTMAYSLEPATIIEVGSGHSTRFLARALQDRALEARTHEETLSQSRLISIDPAPRRAIDELCFEVYRAPLSNCPASLFAELKAGDILFVDGSHVLMPGTDVDRLFTGILPTLTRGVIVHIHDIFLPDPYPSAWRWRNYNEQLLIAALLGAGRFKILAASHYLRQYHPTRLAKVYAPSHPGAYESSLWVELI